MKNDEIFLFINKQFDQLKASGKCLYKQHNGTYIICTNNDVPKFSKKIHSAVNVINSPTACGLLIHACYKFNLPIFTEPLIAKVSLTCKVEKSDHDGYCSGDECEYSVENITQIVNYPSKGDLKIGDKIDPELISGSEYLNSFEPCLNYSGSRFCDNSVESNKNGLELHDFKITVIKATVIDFV